MTEQEIELTQKYIDDNMVDDEEFISLLGKEKNGKVFRYEGETYLIIRGSGISGLVTLWVVSNFPNYYTIYIHQDELHNWMCNRAYPKYARELKRELKRYDENTIQI